MTSPFLYTIGDSHAKYGFLSLKRALPNYNISITHLGPVLMYSISRDWQSRIRIKPPKFHPFSSVWFFFGEIDCRVHLLRSDKDIISIPELADSYVSAVYQMTQLLQERNCKVSIVGVPPPAPPDFIYNDEKFIVSGSSNERLLVHRQLNNKLKERVKYYGSSLHFIDPFTFAARDDGFMHKLSSSDGVHIDNHSILAMMIGKYASPHS
jgi:hypothetical protein